MNYHHAMYLIGLADMILYHHNTFNKWGYDKWHNVCQFCFNVGLIAQDSDCDGHYLTVTDYYNRLNDIAYPMEDYNNDE